MAKQVYFCFIRPEDISTKTTIFVPMYSCKPCLAFLWWFWSSGFFLAERPFRLCRYRTCFTVDIDTFVPVSSSIFTRSFAVVLGWIFTFCTKVRSSLGDIPPCQNVVQTETSPLKLVIQCFENSWLAVCAVHNIRYEHVILKLPLQFLLPLIGCTFILLIP